jgi:glycolate oxidase
MTTKAEPREAVSELQRLLGKRWVLHTPEDLLVYEYDGTIDRGAPQAIVFPNSTEDVAGIMQIATRHGLPVVPRGAGTGLSGGALAIEGGIVMAMTRMKRILEIDEANRIAVVEPGVVNLELSKATEPLGLQYVPDPSSQRACTLGGNVAENSGGPHCLAYGVTTNHVLGMEIVLADGSVMWLGGRSYEAPGYDLRGAVIGSEGTLCVVTKIIVRLMPLQPAVRTLLGVFSRVDDATAAVSAVIGRGIVPSALEMIDEVTIRAVEPALHVGYPEDAGAVLLIEVDGAEESVVAQTAKIEETLHTVGARQVRVAADQAERDLLWSGRKGALGALGRLAPNYYILDGVVPRTKLPEVIRRTYEIGAQYGFMVANVFHAGDGNLHPTILFDERVEGATSRVLDAGGEIMRLCIDVGGTLTGEHGIGLEKREYMTWIFTEADIDAMRRLKRAFGADERFNPGKIFPMAHGHIDVFQRKAAEILGPDAYI